MHRGTSWQRLAVLCQGNAGPSALAHLWQPWCLREDFEAVGSIGSEDWAAAHRSVMTDGLFSQWTSGHETGDLARPIQVLVHNVQGEATTARLSWRHWEAEHTTGGGKSIEGGVKW